MSGQGRLSGWWLLPPADQRPNPLPWHQAAAWGALGVFLALWTAVMVVLVGGQW